MNDAHSPSLRGPLSVPWRQADIQRILPHRYPFLLVDRVTEFVPGLRIAGLKRFSANEAFVGSCIPEAAPVPGGFLIEAVTQLGALLVLERPEMEGKVAVILQIPSARMLKPALAGDTVRLEAEVIRLRPALGELRGRAYVGAELVAEGHMRFAVADASALFPSQSPS